MKNNKITAYQQKLNEYRAISLSTDSSVSDEQKEEAKNKVEELVMLRDNVNTALHTGGHDNEGEVVSLRDALAFPDSHLAFQHVITEIVQETKEPTLVGDLLLDTIYTSDRGHNQVTLRTIGALGELDIEVAEEGEYKEVVFGRGQGSLLHVNYKKFGLKLKITEEMILGSQWGIIELWVRKVVQLFKREREKRIFSLLAERGHPIFDNVNPNNSELGRTLGRDIQGIGNASITLPDLLDMYGYLLSKGYTANVMLVHPMHWAMFAKDPVIREAGLVKGDISQWLNSQVSKVNPFKYIGDYVNNQRLGNGTGPDLTQEEANQLLQTKPEMPSFSPLSGLTVLPSPYVPYNREDKTASIIMLDSTSTGAIVINQPITLDTWDNKENDVKVIKIKERYGLIEYDEGRAIAVAHNISLNPNEIFQNPHTVLTDLPVINRKD